MLYVNYHTQLGRTLLMFLANPSRIVSEYIFVSPGNPKILNLQCVFPHGMQNVHVCEGAGGGGGEAMLRPSYRLLPTIRLPFSLSVVSLVCVCFSSLF